MATVEVPGRQLRKSTLLGRSQDQRPSSAPLSKDKPFRNEKGRRGIFKRRPVKAALAPASPFTSKAVVHRGQLWTIGDVVAVEDIQGDLYYAQVIGLLTDEYGEKSASLAWLVPSDRSGAEFDPNTYLFGMIDDLPRKLDCLCFITHLSPDHFKSGISSV